MSTVFDDDNYVPTDLTEAQLIITALRASLSRVEGQRKADPKHDGAVA